ncbi:early nodulin-like protein 1 [Momordica charantia]|uniref:Early nodulin-like protein 1 n=1 Tax=Momordica charantia TaxID=3673 RepID=A0A6J1CFH4_MOMCH|nr:early nodulin-like protein 1 [Momordica charantia]
MPSFSAFLALAALFALTAAPTFSEAYKFVVGGKDGWVFNPSEPFNHWAERNRFQVNDTLYFKYQNGTDSVLVVSKDDYFSCNTKNPIVSFQDGDSIFKFDRSGPFYFISGNADRCQKGQKLIVVVLALTHNHHHRAPPTPTADSPDSAGGFTAPVPAPAKNSALGGAANVFSFGVISAVLLSSLVGLSL